MADRMRVTSLIGGTARTEGERRGGVYPTARPAASTLSRTTGATMSKPSSVLPAPKRTVRKTPGRPVASTSVALPGTNTTRPVVPGLTRSGWRSASQTARAVEASMGGGASRASRDASNSGGRVSSLLRAELRPQVHRLLGPAVLTDRLAGGQPADVSSTVWGVARRP